MLRSLRQLCLLLTLSQRWAFSVLVAGMLLVGVLEIVAIGAVPVFIRILMAPDTTTCLPQWVLESFSLDSQFRVTIFGGALLFTTVLLKNVGVFLVTAFRVYLVKHQQWYLIDRICRVYVDAEFEFHLAHSSYELMRNANVEIQKIMNSVMTPLLSVIMNSVATIAVVLVLFWLQPFASAILFAVTTVMAVVYIGFIRKQVADHARNAQHQRAEFINQFNMVIGSLPEIRILRKEDVFHQKLSHSAKVTSDAQRSHMLGTLAANPYLETVVTGGFVCLMVLLAGGAQAASETAPMLGLLAAGILRVRSLSIQILSGVTQIQANHVAVGPVHDHLHTLLRHREWNSGGTVRDSFDSEHDVSRIVFSNVSYEYPDAAEPAVSDLCFSVNKGCLVGIFGASGSGKSTLLKLLLGLLRPSSGTFCGLGIDVARDPAKWQSQLGYVPQSVYLLDDTIKRNIAFGVPDDEVDHVKLCRAAERAQLTEFIQSLPDGFDADVGEFGGRLSGGQRQRIGIARALYNEPTVLILDEITSALDSKTEDGVVKELLELRGSCTTFFVTHRLELMADFECVLELQSGRLKQRAPVRLAS